jgi:hypothetical protein
MTSSHHAQIQALHQAGQSTAQIAAALGLPFLTVWRWTLQLGLTPIGTQQRHGDRVLELHNQGKCPTAIASDLGIRYDSARFLILAAGLTPHRYPYPRTGETI